MSFCNTICNNPFIKVTKIEKPLPILKETPYYDYDDYYEYWDHGEVEWEFHDSRKYSNNEPEIFKKVKKIDYVNSVYEKYFKNRLYIRIRKSYVREAYSSFIKNAYKDVVKIENFAYEFQDLALNDINIKSNIVESDLAVLLIATCLGLIYNKNKIENIENLRLIQRLKNKKEKMEDYAKIRRSVTLFFVVIATIFGRNIRNAE
jgi:hypothetical protein